MGYRALQMTQAAPGMYLRQGNTFTLVVMWVLTVDMGADQELYESKDDDTQDNVLYSQHIVGLTHLDLAIDLQDALEDAVARHRKGVQYTTQPEARDKDGNQVKVVVNR